MLQKDQNLIIYVYLPNMRSNASERSVSYHLCLPSEHEIKCFRKVSILSSMFTFRTWDQMLQKGQYLIIYVYLPNMRSNASEGSVSYHLCLPSEHEIKCFRRISILWPMFTFRTRLLCLISQWLNWYMRYVVLQSPRSWKLIKMNKNSRVESDENKTKLLFPFIYKCVTLVLNILSYRNNQ
jgi:hypothetical protein